MKAPDIFSMCLRNLFRRKLRTMLTVLGVVIGCTSIVIMVSLGIGTKVAQEKMLAEMGDLTLITVTAPQARAKLDEQTAEVIKKIPGVEVVSLKKSLEGVEMKLFAGFDRRYLLEGVSIVGLEPEAIEALGYKLQDGTYPLKGSESILIGEQIEYSFRDTLRPEGHDMVDRYGSALDLDAFEFAEDVDFGMEEPAPVPQEEVAPPKPFFDGLTLPLSLELQLSEENKMSFPIRVQGRMKEDFGKGYETSEGLIVPYALLTSIEKSAGIKSDEHSYSQSMIVKVTGIEKVAEVEKKIKDMRLQTSSMESIRKPLEKEARQKQLTLGGLGGISLFVAAIGITNTMIMSISERAREIGIMKALGCDLKDLRILFLTEAASIGLLGGLTGSGLSLGISAIMNVLAARGGGGAEMFEKGVSAGTSLSIIPFWLIAFAIVFSIGIGLISGYYPANRAVRMSALEAMRGE